MEEERDELMKAKVRLSIVPQKFTVAMNLISSPSGQVFEGTEAASVTVS